MTWTFLHPLSHTIIKRITLDVRISNITTRTVKIPPKALLYEVQPVIIEDALPNVKSDENTDDVISLVEIPNSILTNEQHHQVHSILQQN
jgi:hypothetical protein